MTDRLAQATALLEGRLRVPVHSARAAAWLARGALEATLPKLINAKGVPDGAMTTASRLICLDSLYAEDDPELAVSAQYAWDQLSQACHHPAYDLAPTHSEVAALVAVVHGIRARLTTAPGAGLPLRPGSPERPAARRTPPG